MSQTVARRDGAACAVELAGLTVAATMRDTSRTDGIVADHGRILTVTTVGGVVGQPFADAYCCAKLAVEGLMQSLAVVAERFGVWVSVIEPGAVASEFVANVSRPAEAGAG